MENQKFPSPQNSKFSKPDSSFSFEDCPPLKVESSEQMLVRDTKDKDEEVKTISPSFRRKLPKPKTEVFFSPKIIYPENPEDEDVLPILERRKNRESTHKLNPFSNLSRFSSRTWIRNNSKNTEKISIGSTTQQTKPIEFLKSSLHDHFLFKDWDPFLLEKLVSELQCMPVKSHEVLLDKGTPIKSFYVIAQGMVELRSINGVDRHSIGDLLCVSSIFKDLESGLEIVAIEDSQLWGLEFVKFQEILKSNAYSALQENRRFLDCVHYFDNLSSGNKVEIAFYLKTEKLVRGALLEENWEHCDHLYIVKSGVLKVTSKSEEGLDHMDFLIREKQVIGEDKVGFESKIGKVYVDNSCEEAVLLRLCKKTLRLVLGTKYTRMVQNHELRRLMTRSDFLVGLDPITKEKVIRKLKVLEGKKGDVVWLTESPKKLVFLLKGQLVTENGNLILDKKGIFDEDALFQDKQPEFKQIIMGEDGLYSEITFEKLANVLKTNSLHDYFLVLRQAFKKELFDLGSPSSPFIHIKYMSQALKASIREIRTNQKYELIKILKGIGDGQFGLVLLAKIDDRYFALKVISRFWVIQNHIEEYLVNEKKICRMVESPFIIHLDFTFRDTYNIYFLFEYIEGIDLFKFMNISGIIPTPLAQFYAANLILAIEVLHNRNIIHRDLKPENIMISKNGYLKVIDLGAAKLFAEDSVEMISSKSSGTTYQKPSYEEDLQENAKVPLMRTFTLIGTPEYIAPETIRGTGYHFPVDLWALGVIIFEMLCGYCPFGHNKSEPMEIYQSILEDDVKFPKSMKDSRAKKIIRQLLSKSPEERSDGSFNALKAKKWFDDIKWNEIGMQKPGIPPYIPENKGERDECQELIAKNITLKYVLENSSLEDLKKQAELGGLVEDKIGWDEIF